MKTIFKYLLNTGHGMLLLFLAGIMPANTKRNAVCVTPSIKKVAIVLYMVLLSQTAFCQRNSYDLQPDSMFCFGIGASNIFINRQAFDQWTRTNYSLTESHNLSTLIDLGYFYNRLDFGVDFNVGSAFSTYLFYLGARLTNKRSPVSSWLNFEIGDYSGIFKNIAPVNYVPTPDQQGQQLELHYDNTYIGLTSRNYLNFLHFNVRLGRQKIPFNTGFYVGVGYQPGRRDWRYGYYNTDTVFVSTKIHSIPKLGQVQVNTGVFVGF